jgi:hypothetical protein
MNAYAYALVAFALTEVCRRSRRLAAAFIILSLCTFPLWADNRDSWFEWAKIFSVLLPMVVVGFMLIAVFEERQGTFWHIEKITCGDLIVDFPLGWCFLYTTWNAAFLLGCIPDEFAGGLAILIACELYSVLGRHDLYLMGRIYTLAFFVIQLGTTNVLPFMDSSSWANQVFVDNWGLFNIACGVGYVTWYNWQMYTGDSVKTFRHPASAPKGIYSEVEIEQANSGFGSRFYFHKKKIEVS